MKRILALLRLMYFTIIMMSQTDVDTHIAVNDQQNPNTFVLIISNEHYRYEQPVPFALNDGTIFKLYCEKTLGIPEKNIRYAPDATLNDIRRQLMWLENVMKAYKGEARAIVYYSGHGMPSEDSKQAYLLPVDGDSRLAESGMSTKQLYKQLGKLPSQGTIVLLDACFSGARRDGKMLASSRGIAIKAKEEAVTGNVVVFSAAQGDETAYPYEEQKHGLFTYYLLSTLQESGGCISLGDLSDKVTTIVTRKSFVENDKGQTPSINPSPSANWRDWMFADKAATHIQVIEPQSTPNTKREHPTHTESVASSTTIDVPNLAAETSSQAVKSFIIGNVAFKMILVEGGRFQMGATKTQDRDAFDDEKPVHQVTLSPFYIGETEVTQELWEAVMGNNPSYYKGAKRPVENVNWHDCRDFIYKLSKITGVFFRLPTEAEWEFAARGGNKSCGYKYCGSNTLGNVAWYEKNSAIFTHNVKTKQPNELGIYDMSGNVEEWCQDWYGNYNSNLQNNPSGASSGSRRVLRGGCWGTYDFGCRVSNRGNSEPEYRYEGNGLRLALNAFTEESTVEEHAKQPSRDGTSTSTLAKQVITVGNVSFTMIYIDGGTFKMGATREQGTNVEENEKPVHQVALSPFYIGETEVTQELWEAVMGNNPSVFKEAKHPVELVSWDDCQVFIAKLNVKTGLKFRLPTEAEWEFAARGGNKSRNYKYSGSNTLSNVGRYNRNTGESTCAVKTKQANELGLYDMSGNVWEWCHDYFDLYTGESQTDPSGPSEGSYRVHRGGSWSRDGWNSRVSHRSGMDTNYKTDDLGLRLAL